MELFYHHKIIVLLTLLYEDVFAIDQVSGSHHLVQGDLFLVDTHAVSLRHFASLVLRWEDLRVGSHKIYNRDTDFEVSARNMLLRNTIENIEESLLVKFLQTLFGGFAKENVGVGS